MFPHPDTVCALVAMDHRQVLAEAARARRTAAIPSPSGARPAVGAAPCHRLRSVLLGRGRRDQGAAPATEMDGVVPGLPVAH